MDSIRVPNVKRKELLVEFFGAFVPGFVFTVLAFSVIGWASYLAMTQLSASKVQSITPTTIVEKQPQPTGAIDIAVVLEQLPSLVKLLVPLFILAISYIVGSIAMRRKIAVVDRSSWWEQHIKKLANYCGTFEEVIVLFTHLASAPSSFSKWVRWLRLSPQERMDTTVHAQTESSASISELPQAERELAEHLFELNHSAARTPNECEFPYHNLRGSLEAQGLTELAKMVPWDTVEKMGLDRCTAPFFESVKLRVKTYFPDAGNELLRLEATIRLLSTSWYLARWLKRITLATMAFLFCTFVLSALTTFSGGVDLEPPNGDELLYLSLLTAALVIIIVVCSNHLTTQKKTVYLQYYNILALKDNKWMMIQGMATVLLCFSIVVIAFQVISTHYMGKSIGLVASVNHLCLAAVQFSNCLIFTFLVAVVSRVAQVTIDKDFHRARTREVIATFHIAWLTFRHQPNILKDLIPDWQPCCLERFTIPIDHGPKGQSEDNEIEGEH